MVRTMKRKSDVPALIKAMIVEMQGTSNDVGGGSGPSSSHKKSLTIEENSRRGNGFTSVPPGEKADEP